LSRKSLAREFLICPVVLLPKEGDMKPTKVLQEIRKMRFEDVYEGWNEGRLTLRIFGGL
jgi:hypothetical protein